MNWGRFERLDEVRRFQGAILDAAGLGPVETPWRPVHREAGVILRQYASGESDGPLVFIVPAPIKRCYIWDLAPEVSAVRRCLETGGRVFLADWQQAPPHFGLADYAERLVLACLDATGGERAILLGHSLGGLFAAIFAALHPERVQALVLLAAPLRFGGEQSLFTAMAAGVQPDRLPDALPGSSLSTASMYASPEAFGMYRWADALASIYSAGALRTHWQVERWMLDEFPLPRRLVEELVTLLVREDRFAGGTLEVNGRRAAPSMLSAPVLCVVDPGCPVVPPVSVLPVLNAFASSDKTVLPYCGDLGVALRHVGPLVGRRAHARLWPPIVQWIKRHA